MTDLERFLDLYRSFGITLEARTQGDAYCITLEAHDHEYFDGYSGFCSDVYFDKNGKFLRQGFWE